MLGTDPSIHISDGGGPQDTIRELTVHRQIEHLIETQFPRLTHHPLALPKSRGVDLDTQTMDILTATHQALNTSNPTLAEDCWLCLSQGTPMPLAFPANISILNEATLNCTLNQPFRVQPVLFLSSTCIYKDSQNNTFDIPVGFASFVNCSHTVDYNTSLCPGPGRAFVCGNNLAFTVLPSNWTGLCVLATLLPDIDIIPGDEPVPVPAFDHFAGRHKRALTIIPLLVGLGVSGAVATGTMGLGVAVHSYTKLSKQLIDDVQSLTSTISDIQDQLDSLAEVVLQNRRGLDLLTAEQVGICLALQERCCFYANKSGIVRDKIKNLQEDLEKWRRALAKSPFLTGLNGLLPYLLPLLGPLITIILILTFAPWILRRVTTLVRDQLNVILGKPIQIHYHQLEMLDRECDPDSSRPSPTGAA
ncbi:syncytin-2-like [Sturnira hondurensis]|uniref:syncytin-2-like n=1 Tax=Sturnira hondurensis TaxID=192404 RepID=UPI001879EEA4|nr:syncytin-2-like [Sturnira hondurensis]